MERVGGSQAEAYEALLCSILLRSERPGSAGPPLHTPRPLHYNNHTMNADHADPVTNPTTAANELLHTASRLDAATHSLTRSARALHANATLLAATARTAHANNRRLESLTNQVHELHEAIDTIVRMIEHLHSLIQPAPQDDPFYHPPNGNGDGPPT